MTRVAAFNRGIFRIPNLEALLGAEVVWGRSSAPDGIDAAIGWGLRRYANRARLFATERSIPFWSVEDGFLRSFGTGKRFPPLSLVVDAEGIYYDSTRPSTLEAMLASSFDPLEGLHGEASRAKSLLLSHRLSKYNHAPALAQGSLDGAHKRVLVVDQTAGDMSISLGGATASTFAEMLSAARAENPDAIIYVKTHPEVSSGRKRGYLTAVESDTRTVVLRNAVNPISLIGEMDRVYVVTSTMGFEALLAGKPVTVFGMPWYAGWGATDDRQRCGRRGSRRTVDELFAAAYFHYARYLNPVTLERGSIFDAIDWLVRQQEMASRFIEPSGSGRMLCVGFRRWKAANVRPMLSLFPESVHFVRDTAAAVSRAPRVQDCLVHWGDTPPRGLETLAARTGARLLRMEDGFVRSVGLGSDLIPPMSLVLDDRGIYFAPDRPSALEDLLNETCFSGEDLSRAQVIRHLMMTEGITKYNSEPRGSPAWARQPTGKIVVLVPGQVEDDASILSGCEDVRTNLGLLQAARAAHPHGFVVYKPHPDVLAGNRVGAVALTAACRFADHVETSLSAVSCIEACDVVHTMTSLTGFDALLRGKRVVVHGRPFYAGWGLTDDRLPIPRRRRALSIDELAAGALLHYPLYWDSQLKGYTTCEAVLRRIVESRARLEASEASSQTRAGHLTRQWRKLKVLLRNWRG